MDWATTLSPLSIPILIAANIAFFGAAMYFDKRLRK